MIFPKAAAPLGAKGRILSPSGAAFLARTHKTQFGLRCCKCKGDHRWQAENRVQMGSCHLTPSISDHRLAQELLVSVELLLRSNSASVESK